MSHSTFATDFSSSSFVLTNINDDLYNAQLEFAYIWCTSLNYNQWRLSFKFVNTVRGFKSINFKLLPGHSLAQQVANPDGRNYTRVVLIPYIGLHTTDNAIDLACIPARQGTRVCDIMRIMHNYMPYYELTANNDGFSAWVIAHTRNFLQNGVFVNTTGSDVLATIERQITEYNRTPGYIYSVGSQWPFVDGTVHSGPP